MNPLIIGALVGAGLGYMQNKDEKKNFKEEQKLNAIKARFSPWTHIQPTNPQQPRGMLSAMGSGALGGLFAGQAIGASMGDTPQVPVDSGAALSTPAEGTAFGPPTRQNAALMQYGGPTNEAAYNLNNMQYDMYGRPIPFEQSGQNPWVSMGRSF